MSAFPQTLDALRALLNQLKCSSCGEVVRSPCNLGSCQHFFCRKCCSDILGKSCPICHLPAYVKDAQVNRQLHNIVSLCQQLRTVLTTKTDDLNKDSNLDRTSDEEANEISSTNLNSCQEGETTNTADESAIYNFVESPVPNEGKKQNGSQKKKCASIHVQRKAIEGRSSKKATRLRNNPKEHGSSDRQTAKSSFPSSVSESVEGASSHMSDDTNTDSNLHHFLKRKRDSYPPTTPEHGKSSSSPNSATKRKNKSWPPKSKELQEKVDSASLMNLSLESLSTPKTSRRRQSLTPSSKKAPGTPTTKKNAKGETPLHIAAIKGETDKVRDLLKQGADPNMRDNAGWTPLHEACNHGHAAIIPLLLDNGAMINIPGMDNDTPLHDAVNNYRLNCVKLLISRGANINARNIHGWTPKDLARTEEMKKLFNTAVVAPSEPAGETSQVGSDMLDFQPVCILGTGLNRDDKRKLQKCATLLHGKLVDEFCSDVTHIVTSCNMNGVCPRTSKYLMGVLSGKWIVNIEWVNICLEYGSRVCEEAFEIPGTSLDPDTFAAKKGRENRQKQLPALFDGCQFYFYGTFESPVPSKEELIDLVKIGGGKVLTREPKLQNLDESTLTVPFHAAEDGQLSLCGVFIIHDRNIVYPTIKSNRMCALPVTWIMDSVSNFKLMEQKN